MNIEILIFILTGFMAQLIDGALGMAYGVISTTLLLGMNIPPPIASMCVHTSEVFTSTASGISHINYKNFDIRLVKNLIIPGVIGGILGAYILTEVPTGIIKPVVSLYLLSMGIIITLKALKRAVAFKEHLKGVRMLALIGGFLDAVGGGGWGPIVTSTLVARDANPRFTIGSVNIAEIFVTISESAAFILILKTVNWRIVIGLLIGGVLAAPLGAYICRRAPMKILMFMVGILIAVLSIRNLYLAL
jgi:uncharacterized membrane protein YfcA